MATSVPAQRHFLAIEFILPGHVAPLRHLCKYLAASGCKVTLLKVPDTPSDVDSIKYQDGVRVCSRLPLPPPVRAPASKKGPAGTGLVGSGLFLYARRFSQLGDEVVEIIKGLPPAEDGAYPPSCVLSDVFVNWAPGLANKLGLPWIALWTSTVAELVIYYNTPQLVRKGIYPFAGEFSEEPVTCIPGVPVLRPADYPSLAALPEPMKSNFKKVVELVVAAIPQAKTVLVNSVYELEKPAVDALRTCNIDIRTVGPLHLLSARNVPSELAAEDENRVVEWLDQKPASSVVYVAFGTTMPMQEAQFVEIAAALEESGHYFLWSIRDSSPLPDGFEDRVTCSGQGKLVDFAPQLAVLNHLSLAGFLTHCGWNSVLESIASGVSMIARPITADQKLTRKLLVEDWGLALGVHGVDVSSRESIKASVNRLMEGGSELKEKVANCKRLVEKAVDGGSSANGLEEFIMSMFPFLCPAPKSSEDAE